MEQGKPFSATESPLVDFDAVCQKVRAAVEPARAHAVSLHDENGDVLWLSESSMGPDEHNAVREAIEAFSSPKAPPILAYDLGDARSAVLLRAVSARRAMVGAIMLVMDTRVIRHDERGAIKFMTPKLQRVLTDFAGMRPDIEPPPEAQAAARATAARRKGSCPPPAPATKATAKAATPARKPQLAEPLAPSAPASKVAWTARVRPAASAASAARPAANAPHGRTPGSRAGCPGRNAAPRSSRRSEAAGAGQRRARMGSSSPLDEPPRLPRRRRRPPHERRARRPRPRVLRRSSLPRHRTAPTPAPTPVEHVLEDSIDRQPPAVSPEIDRLHAALRRSPIALHVQRLVPLTKGSQLRRYEVLLRSGPTERPMPRPTRC